MQEGKKKLETVLICSSVKKGDMDLFFKGVKKVETCFICRRIKKVDTHLVGTRVDTGIGSVCKKVKKVDTDVM